MPTAVLLVLHACLHSNSIVCTLEIMTCNQRSSLQAACTWFISLLVSTCLAITGFLMLLPSIVEMSSAWCMQLITRAAQLAQHDVHGVATMISRELLSLLQHCTAGVKSLLTNLTLVQHNS